MNLAFLRKSAALSDPVRKILTLEGFAETETAGGLDIAAAARCVRDEPLRRQLERHAADELRHGEMFRSRASALRAVTTMPDRSGASPIQGFAAPGRGSPEAPLEPGIDRHGFFDGSSFDDVGEIAYITMLHVAERRAATFFRRLRRNIRDDEETAAILDDVLEDEIFHVGYTGKCLSKWANEGRGREVREALARTRGKRTFDAWRRFGSRAAAHAGTALMFVIYVTIAAPFALLTRLRRERTGWQAPRERRDPGQLRSQF